MPTMTSAPAIVLLATTTWPVLMSLTYFTTILSFHRRHVALAAKGFDVEFTKSGRACMGTSSFVMPITCLCHSAVECRGSQAESELHDRATIRHGGVVP